MSAPPEDGKPIDTPSASDYIQQVRTFFQDNDDPVSEPGHRVLELIKGLSVKASAVYAEIKRDVKEIACILKRKPKLVRDLNAVLPRGFAVQCPVVQHLVDATVLEYVLLLTSDDGYILSTSSSNGIGVPFPSSIQELRTALPLKDQWQTIQTMCSDNVQWGSCLSQLLQREFEDPRIDEDYKRIVSRRQVHLAKLTGILPPSLFLHNVVRSKAVYHSDCGSFADIAEARIKGTPVCLKILRVYSSQDDGIKKSKAFLREVLLWSRLNHPNILPYLGAQVSEGLRFVLISPWMSNGNLRSFLKVNPNHDRMKACFQISCGLQYLHGLIPPVYHRDVKAVNILVKDDLQCCLADFGLSSIAGSQRLESKSSGVQGSLYWQAPEVVLSESFESLEKTLDSATTDVYAYGCTVFEVYTGNPPFHDLIEARLIRAHMGKRKPQFPAAIQHQMSTKFRALVCSCWNSAPARPTMLDISNYLEAELGTRDSALTHLSDEDSLTDTVDRVQVTEYPASTEYISRKLEFTGLEPNAVVESRVYSSDDDYLPSSSEGPHHRLSSIITGSPLDFPRTEGPGPALATGLTKINSNGLATPPPNDHIFVDSLSTKLEPRLTEEPEVMEHVEDLAPRPRVHMSALVTPPKTPTLSPGRPQPLLSPTSLRPDSPMFIPQTGIKIARTRNLSIDAPEFRPAKYLRTATLHESAVISTV
ncbi:Dual specificity protein kinase pyk1, partial [Termitomyces sp. T112]